MDVEDQRFKGLFESHEFAIDPSNPKFSGTKAMKGLLAAGRKKRGREDDENVGGDDESGDRSKKAKANAEGGELDALVNKIKRKRVA